MGVYWFPHSDETVCDHGVKIYKECRDCEEGYKVRRGISNGVVFALGFWGLAALAAAWWLLGRAVTP